MTKTKQYDIAMFVLYVSLFLVFVMPILAFSQEPNEVPENSEQATKLKERIFDYNVRLEELEGEITGYEKQLEEVGNEKQTLETAVKTLDISRQKISTNIRVTENRISATALQIEELGIEIGEKEERIEQNVLAISKSLREIDEIESRSLVEVLLTHENLSEFWNQIESLERFQLVVRDELKKLVALKDELQNTRIASERKKGDLSDFKVNLNNQKIVLDITRDEKNEILEVTKNKETNYQKLLEEKRALREEFEDELLEAEAQLQLIVDPSIIPSAEAGLLHWPLDSVTVTQYFGNTSFSTNNPQVYNGRGHNGIDLRASQGTPVRSALFGTVVGIGNTDTVCRNASYGKWILIRHNNGLSTLYAHLSLIQVESGTIVHTGDVIGYSGNTGYSTGPHLHFAVFASDGVQIGDLRSRVCGRTYTLPLADLKAYLNPLSYLPEI